MEWQKCTIGGIKITGTRVIPLASNSISGLLPKKPMFLDQKIFRGSSSNLYFPNLKVEKTGAFKSSKSKRLFTCRAICNPEIQVKEEGQPETLDYKVFVVDKTGKKISPWHDIPLQVGDGAFNLVVKMPKESSAKMKVATCEPFTPVKQDRKEENLLYYPYNMHWNYGFLPQTWEDPSTANNEVEGALGDNDPVDVVEIGESRRKIGDVLKVKPLAAFAMIDEGKLDWKIVAISMDDPKASLVNNVDDIQQHFPGTLTAIRDWFRDYKIPDGKSANKFGLGDKAVDKDYAVKVIKETNKSWNKYFNWS